MRSDLLMLGLGRDRLTSSIQLLTGTKVRVTHLGYRGLFIGARIDEAEALFLLHSLRAG